MEDLLHRRFGQLHAHQKNEARHDETGDVFQPPVAEGMMGIRLFSGQAEAQQRHHRGTGVGQVVEGVGGDGHGPADRAGKQLPGKQQQVQADAH